MRCAAPAPAVNLLTARPVAEGRRERLTPFHLTFQERRAEYKRAWQSALTAEDVTYPALALLGKVGYGAVCDAEQLPSSCLYCSDDTPVTEAECRTALADCITRGWLRIIDATALRTIADELRHAGILGPIYGLPSLDVVDFTPTGAAVWQRLLARVFPADRDVYPSCHTVRRNVTFYFRTERAAVKWVEEFRAEDGENASVSRPAATGPWRLQWWRRFPNGYRVNVETRSQWGGREGPDAGWEIDHQSLWRTDSNRLRHALDCHGVAVAEWLVLNPVDLPWGETPARLPAHNSERAEQEFGLLASEHACQAALENCLRYGWLTVADGTPSAEVREQLQTAPAFTPVLDAVHCARGDVDFTPTGAALYKMIAAEVAGPDWEDDYGLTVWAETYREEHRYSETEEGFRGIAEGYAKKGEIIRAARVVPVGPWCDPWWKRFERGYRLEMEIGDPTAGALDSPAA